MLKIRWSWVSLIFNMGIPILVRWHLYIEMLPWVPDRNVNQKPWTCSCLSLQCILNGNKHCFHRTVIWLSNYELLTSFECMVSDYHHSVIHTVFLHGINSLVPVRCGDGFKSAIFKLIIQNNSLGTCWEIVLRWMSHNLTDEKSIMNIGSGNGFMPSGNKPWRESMSNKFSNAILCS